MRKISYSYLFRLILFSLLIGAIPVIALGIYFYSASTQIIEKNVRQGNEQILLQTQLRVEQMLRTMDAMIVQYMTSPSVQTYFADASGGMGFEYFSNLNEVSAGMNRLYSYELNVRDIYLVDMKNGIVIRSAVKNPIGEDPDQADFLQYYNDPRPAFRIVKPAEEGDLPSSGGEIVIVNKIPTKPKGLLVVTMGSPDLAGGNVPAGLAGNLAIVNAEGRMVSRSHTANPLTASLVSKIILKLKEKQSGDYFLVEDGGSRYEVSHRLSGYSNWHFFTVTSLADIRSESRAFGLAVVFTCILVLSVMTFAALSGSIKMYSPIRKLKEKVLDERSIPNTGNPEEIRDDFQLIEKRFNLLLSNRSQMEYQVQVQLKQLKEYFVQKLLLGQVNPREIDEKLKLYGFPRTWQFACVMAVQIDTLENTRFQEHDRDLLMSAINNIVGELIPEQERMDVVLIDQYQVTVILSDAEEAGPFKKHVREKAGLVADKVQEFLEISVSIGLSRPYMQLQNTLRAYEESKEALRYGRQLGENEILSVDDVKLHASPDVVSSKMIAKHLLETMKTRNLNESLALFDIFMKELHTSGISNREIILQCCQLVSGMLELVQDLPGFREWYASRDVIGKINALEDSIEVESLVKTSAIEPIIGMLEQNNSTRQMSLTDQMLAMIHQEYACSLTLDVCAARLNFHPRYLGRVFRNRMGVTFSDYLSQYRLNISKQWLIHSDMKIADIADRLQYNSPAAFIRYFRKATNMTPGKYRKQYQ